MRRGLIVAGVVAATCIAAIRHGCAALDDDHKQSLIPAKLHAGNILAKGDCGGLLSAQGAYVMPIPPAIATEIREAGLKLFEDVDAEGTKAAELYFSGPWKPTPLPDDGADRARPNLTCALGRAADWPPRLADDIGAPGGFYRASGGRALIVLPRRRLVVAISSDK